MNVTADGSRTWYGYPHRRDALTLGSTISRKISNRINLVGQITPTRTPATPYPGRQLSFPTLRQSGHDVRHPRWDRLAGITTAFVGFYVAAHLLADRHMYYTTDPAVSWTCG